MTRLSRIVIGFYGASLLLWAYLWKGHLPYHIDTRLYAYPDHAVNLRSFHDGFIPLWNPFIGCGTPHAANWQSACFYPPFWIFNLTGLDDWLMWLALAHAALAFLGCYLWLKSQKADPLGCALGAFSFAGSAHLVSCWANIPFIATACWIPWIFWAAQRALQRPGFNAWAVLALLMSLQLLAGYPFFIFYTLAFLLVWFEFQCPSGKLRSHFWCALSTAGLLTCLQWLPFLEFLTYSWHDRWADYPYFTKPAEYLTLFDPDALGLLGSASYKGSFANAPFNLYIGLAPLALLAFNALKLYRSRGKFWTLAALFWLAWLAGHHFLLWQWIPGPLLEFIEPSKAVGLFVFCAVTSVSTGLGAVPWDSKKTFRVGAWLIAGLWLADLLWVPFRLEHPLPNPFLKESVQAEASALRRQLPAGRMLSLLPAGGMDSSGSNAFEESFERPVISFLPNSNAVWGLRSPEEYLYLQVDGAQNLTRYINKGFGDGYSGGLLDVAGVRLLLMPQMPPNPRYQVLGNYGDELVILNTGASADLRWVPEKEELPGRPEVLNALSRKGNGWETKVYLERKQDGAEVRLEAAERDLKGLVAQDIPGPAGSRSSLFRDLPKPGYAVLNETFAPGWHAWVDGKPTPILRAYGLFMAVALPAGTHQVDLRYGPFSFRLGLFLSLAALGGLLFGFSIQMKKFKKRKTI